jgi:hypothetical protein
MYPEIYDESCTRPENKCVSPNIYVVGELKRAYYKKHGLYETDN